MGGKYYQISEASKLLEVEAHVLRYWEDEIGIEIPRNEMGHREYSEEHLQMFRQIKEMKRKGYQLKAIRAALCTEVANLPETVCVQSNGNLQFDQFQTMMTHVVAQALLKNNEYIGKQLEQHIGEHMEERLLRGMGKMMALQEDRQEERFRKLDETLRAYQRGNKSRQEAAVTRSPVVKLTKRKKYNMFKKRSI
jgi:DNA-binding transcriptional MerR regulator